ncbi:MAG: phospho-N-acetylmuramoyl-pentapeptide-transferase, partial [Atopobiaceae bacterium]|nr:phospho-N-acetylmuramoyl-pentapeptide-transferase [Atopobiaceae bacterium]
MIGNPAYPTYQVFLSLGIAAVLTMALMPFFIKLMRREGVGQQIRADGPQRHLVKQGTPTMGGVVILLAMLITCLLMAKMSTDLTICLVATLATAALGLMDDIESVAHERSLGLTPKQKMLGLTVISVAFCLVAVNRCGVAPVIAFPGGFVLDLGVLTTTIAGVRVPWLYVLFVFLLMAGLSNSVNLTDGLD